MSEEKVDKKKDEQRINKVVNEVVAELREEIQEFVEPASAPAVQPARVLLRVLTHFDMYDGPQPTVVLSATRDYHESFVRCVVGAPRQTPHVFNVDAAAFEAGEMWEFIGYDPGTRAIQIESSRMNHEHWGDLNGGVYIEDPEDRTNYLLDVIDSLKETVAELREK